MQKEKITIQKVQSYVDNFDLGLTIGKPSLLSPFVVVRGADLWNNRIFEGKNLKQVDAFVRGLVFGTSKN